MRSRCQESCSPANLISWLRLTGDAPSPGGADPLGHHLHLATREPDANAYVPLAALAVIGLLALPLALGLPGRSVARVPAVATLDGER